MGSRYKGNLKKGDLVHIIETYGNNAGTPDFKNTYKIRSIGTKMAVVDRIDPRTGEKSSWRGRSYYLVTEEEAARRRSGGWHNWSPTTWAMVFCPVGSEPGWDPIMNI